MSETPVHFGEIIKAARQAAGLTMEGLSLRAGCTKSYIWQLERSASMNRVSADLLNRIANALDVSLASLMGDSERLHESLTAADAQFFKDYMALSVEDRGRFRKVCELAFGSASPEEPAQDKPPESRRRKMIAGR